MHLPLVRLHGPKDVDQGIIQMLLQRRLWHDDGTFLELFLARYVFIYLQHLGPVVKLLLFWQSLFEARLRRLLPIQELSIPRWV